MKKNKEMMLGICLITLSIVFSNCTNGNQRHSVIDNSVATTESAVTTESNENTQEFPEYGFSIKAPCLLSDVSSQSRGDFLLNYGGITDGESPETMAAYQLVVTRIPVGYKDLQPAKFEKMMDELLKSRMQSFRNLKSVKFGYEEYQGYVGETTHNGFGQKGVIFRKDNLLIALTVITNNHLEEKFNKFTNGFKTIAVK